MKTLQPDGSVLIRYSPKAPPSLPARPIPSTKSFSSFYGDFTASSVPPPGGEADWTVRLKDGHLYTYHYIFSDSLEGTVMTIDDVNHYSPIPYTGTLGGVTFNQYVRAFCISKELYL